MTKRAASGPVGTICDHEVTTSGEVTTRAGNVSNLTRFVTLVALQFVTLVAIRTGVTKPAATNILILLLCVTIDSHDRPKHIKGSK